MKEILKDKEYKWIAAIGTIFIVILLSIYFSTVGTVTSLVQNSIINLIIEIISIFITIILLSRILEKRQRRINKGKAYNIVKFNYFKLIKNFYRSFYLYIAKETFIEDSNGDSDSDWFLKSIKELENNIDTVINEDFFSKKPIGLVFEPTSNNIFDNFSEKEIDNFQMPLSMRQEYETKLNEFTMKFSVILPDDLRTHLFNLSNELESSPLFMSPYQMGMKPDPKNINFDPKDVQNHALVFLEIFEELFKYFKDQENK